MSIICMSCLEKCRLRFFTYFLDRFSGVGLCKLLYILEIISLSDVSMANKFSHTVGSHFILLMVSFAVQKIFSLMDYYLFIFFP